MHRGYIKLWRKILEWEWFASSETFHVFAYLFLSANHLDGSYKGVPVKRGQVLTGRKSISEKTGISERSIRTALTRLKATGEITIKTTNKFSIITLCNYDIYNKSVEQNDQQNDQQAVTPATSNRPATDQQPTTNKNDKNEKNEKNEKNKPLWRENSDKGFEEYLKISEPEWDKLYEDWAWIKRMREFYRGCSIRLTLDKMWEQFWGTKAGWKNKRSRKTKEMDWKSTIERNFEKSKVKIPYGHPDPEQQHIEMMRRKVEES